jgi:hypothetical protein
MESTGPRNYHAEVAPGRRRSLTEIIRDKVRQEPMLLAFMVAAVSARVAFWLISNRMFEDGLTTITHARNVPLGLGLVHHLGEGHVHGFTSALSVLIPLAGEVIHQGTGMLAVRIASLVAVCVALIYARLICRELGLGAFPTAFVLAYLSFDQNMIFYGMSGMETQVAVAILLGGVFHVRRNDVIASGVFLGLAPMARPEFVLWMAPAFLYLALRNARVAARAAGVAAGIVVPWIVFTFLYYGSPIPNTIVAKSTAYATPPFLAGGSPLPWLDWLFNQLGGHLALLISYLEPFREVWSTAAVPVPAPLLVVIAIITLFLFVAGLRASSGVRDFWPITAFLVLFFAYRVYFLPALFYGDWYMPPFLALVMIVVGLGMQRLGTLAPLAPKAFVTVLSVAYAIHMPFSFIVEGKVQAIENQVRTNAGEYLRVAVKPGESVVSESSGYIGFFGNVKLYDYPGLTSPASVHVLKNLPIDKRDSANLIAVLSPDWIILRPWELDDLHKKFPAVAAMYIVDRVFEMPGVPESDLDVGGATIVSFGGYVEISTDEKFTVLKRIKPAGA